MSYRSDIVEHMFVSEYEPEPTHPTDVMAEVCERRRQIELEEIRWLLSLVDLEMSSTVSYDGHTTVTSFLTARAGMAYSHARRLVALASQLNRFPRLRRAALEGKLTIDQLQVLCPAGAAHPEEFLEMEALFIAQAQELTIAELKVAVGYWTQAVEGPRGPIRIKEGSRSHLYTSTDMEGMTRIDGRFLPEAGEIILTAIDSIVSDRIRKAPADESDRRTRSELRADALVDVCDQYLSSPERPQVGGERPHLTVLVDLPTLVGDDYTLAELSSGTPVSRATVERIACDATVRRVVFGPRGLPLDVGRASRNIPSAVRVAVTLRDRHCRFPYCDRPPRFCDIHHVDHWTRDQGPTSVSNCILLCTFHHRALHEGGFSVRHDGQGGLIYTRPDQSILAHQHGVTERPPP